MQLSKANKPTKMEEKNAKNKKCEKKNVPGANSGDGQEHSTRGVFDGIGQRQWHTFCNFDS